jgi:hypothetical protein
MAGKHRPAGLQGKLEPYPEKSSLRHLEIVLQSSRRFETKGGIE